MKTYTREERISAMEKLPRPILDFARSETITNIYTGLKKKHKLNFREIGTISAIANLALIGLEAESAVEHNIHQELPELPNALVRELMADINDRIFKEAKRRLRENIVEKELWDEAERGKKPMEAELAMIAEQQRIEEKDDDSPTVLAESEKIVAAEIERARKELEEAKRELEIMLAERTAKTAGAPAVGETGGEMVEKGVSSLAAEQATIAEGKLIAPTAEVPQEVRIEGEEARVKSEEPSAKKTDPYREPIE